MKTEKTPKIENQIKMAGKGTSQKMERTKI